MNKRATRDAQEQHCIMGDGRPPKLGAVLSVAPFSSLAVALFGRHQGKYDACSNVVYYVDSVHKENHMYEC
jgi:hypothetical protein